MALADHNGRSAGRAYIENTLISPVTNGFNVNLFELDGAADEQFVDMTELFTNGVNMAQPTADYKEIQDPLDPLKKLKLTEVWPIVVEKAYAQTCGGYGHTRTNAADAWTRLTSKPATYEKTWWMKGDRKIYQAGSITFDMINNALAAGKIICIGTQDSIAGTMTTKYGSNLAGDHSYYVKSVQPGKIEVLNPWGYYKSLEKPIHGKVDRDFLKLDSADLNQIVKHIYILDPL
jgi:hypothetical protein